VRKLTPVVLRPWTLPLIVLGLTLPIVVAIYLFGVPAGLMAAAGTVGVIVTVAVRARFDEAIEVAPSGDGRYHVVLVALDPVEEPEPAARVATLGAEGALALDATDFDVRVLVPATSGSLARWTSDVRGARADAQRRLAITLGTLAAAGLDAAGVIGDPDPVQAVEDVLRTTPANEVVFSGSGPDARAAVAEVRRRLDRPVRHLAPEED
jgi:hypothetical protein